MTKGKPWDINETRKLRQLLEEGKTIDEIAHSMVKTRDAVVQKMFDLDLKEKKVTAKLSIFSSSLRTGKSDELPSIEEALKTLNAALLALDQPGLDKSEILRLRSIISGIKIYKEIFSDYLDYRGLEMRLVELEAKYDALVKKSKANAPA